MTSLRRRMKLSFLAGGVVLAAGMTVGLTAPGAAARQITSGTTGHGPKGDNGTIKVHRSTTPVSDPANQPHVCVFYLDAFGFDPNQSVSWHIESWPPTGNRTTVASGTQVLDSSGDGRTGDMTLANGHYKLFWNFNGEHGFAKQKVFWVECASPSPSPSPTPSTTPTPVPSPSPSPTSTPPPHAKPPKPVHRTLPVTG